MQHTQQKPPRKNRSGLVAYYCLNLIRGLIYRQIHLLAELFLLRDQGNHCAAGEDQNRRPQSNIGVVAGLRGLVGGGARRQDVEGSGGRVEGLLHALVVILPEASRQRIAVVAAQLIEQVAVDPQGLVVIRDAVVLVTDLLAADPDGEGAVGIIVDGPAGLKLDPEVLALDVVVQAIRNGDAGIKREIECFIRSIRFRRRCMVLLPDMNRVFTKVQLTNQIR